MFNRLLEIYDVGMNVGTGISAVSGNSKSFFPVAKHNTAGFLYFQFPQAVCEVDLRCASLMNLFASYGS